MFITRADGQLIASLPAIEPAAGQEFSATLWREGAMGSPDVFVSPVHPRLPDGRMATAIVGAVRTPDGNIAGYLGVWVLVERMGRRLSSIEIADQAICQVVDQNGTPLFAKNFAPNAGPAPPRASKIINEIRALKTGSIERDGNLYSFNTIESTGWMTIVEQPKAVAYKPVRDLLDKITIPALWLIGSPAEWPGGRPRPRGGSSAKLFSTRKSSRTCRAGSRSSIRSRAIFSRRTRPLSKWRNASANCRKAAIFTRRSSTK